MVEVAANEARAWDRKWLLISGLCALVAVACFVVAIESAGWKVQWGNVAEWAGGAGTVGALIFAGLALRHSIDARDEDAQAIAEAARRAQAELVSAWYVERRQVQIRRGIGASNYMTVGYGIVRNNSSQPVYNVQLWAAAKWPADGKWNREGWLMVGVNCDRRILGPGDEASWTCHVEDELATVGPPIELNFTDASQRHWMRDPYGALVEVESTRLDEREWIERVRGVRKKSDEEANTRSTTVSRDEES